MKKRIAMLLAVCYLTAAFSSTAFAVEYTFDAPTAGLFGTPTSVETIYVTTEKPVNTDRSKNAAYIPPAFGSPTSYTLNSGELLTPNLVGQNNTVSTVNDTSGVIVMPPTLSNSTAGYTSSAASPSYTEVTQSLYYSDGRLGTLTIPAIGLTVNVYQGTDTATLTKGAGHYTDTSIWDGNVAIAAHNRGITNHFGKIHTLQKGDTITLTTLLGNRTYRVQSATKILATDLSVLDASNENIITLTTCVMNQPDYRWCVVGKAV